MKQTEINFDILGIKEEKFQGITTGFVGKDGGHYDNAWDAVWIGTFNFCGCGDTDYELERFANVLHLTESGGLANIQKDMQIYLYLLDAYGFTEHGFSIYSSFLTEKGKVLLRIVNKEIEDSKL